MSREYNLTEKPKSALRWMVQENRTGELDEEFTVLWVMGPNRCLILSSSGKQPAETPELTPGILDALAEAGLIIQTIKTETKTRKSGETSKNPRFAQTESERSRTCTLTKSAYEAVDNDFVMPTAEPSSPSFNFYAPVNQSIIGTQDRAELTNYINLSELRERIDQEGREDKEELHNALDEVERIIEEGQQIDRGILSRFSGAMERHSWFTSSVMDLLLGFVTQMVQR
jgi:hypothetical protein